MEVTPQRLREEMKKGTAMSLVDVQLEEKYRHTHVPGAMNIPLEQFEQQLAGILRDKDEVIVLYGEYDENGRAQQALKVLEDKGYTKIGHLVGGLMGYQEAGYPTESGNES